MAERKNVPGSRPIATIDNINVEEKYKEKYNKRYFKQLQDFGYIPQKYNNFQELSDDYFDLVLNQKVNEKEAAEILGVDYKNVMGQGFLKLNVSSTGKPRAIEMRALREDIKPDERLYIEQRYGKGFLEDLSRLRELEWGNKKPRKGENVEDLKARIYNAMDKSLYPSSESPFSFKSAKQEADIVRDRLHAAFGKKYKAGEVHRGHGVSALEGAGVGKANLEPELGLLNTAHGAAPRFDPEVMKILNMSSGDLQALYDGYLTYKGLDIDEARYFGTLLAADEGLRELEQGINIYNAKVTTPEGEPAVPQGSIEWRNRRLNEIEQQLRVDLENIGMDPQDAAIEARNKIQEMSYQQSSLFDTTQSVGGPVTVTQTKRPYTVVSPAEIVEDAFGREKEQKPRTRTVYEETQPRGVNFKGGKAKFQVPVVKRQDLSGNQFEMFKKGGGQAALSEGKSLAEVIASGRKWSGTKPPSSSTKPKPKPKTKPSRNIIGAAAAGFEGTGINESHPLGGNVIDTDPLGILEGLHIRTP